MPNRKTLVKFLEVIFAKKQEPFIFIIDEWDCIFRMHKIRKRLGQGTWNFYESY